MRHFITVIPLQTQNNLKQVHYDNKENLKELNSEEDFTTAFPIFIPILNTVKNGEEIRITVIITRKAPKDNIEDYENFKSFKRQLKEIKDKIGFEYGEINEIVTNGEESSGKHLSLFKKLIASFQENDSITADITYGNKPTPIALLMALNFANQFCFNTTIDMLVYGAIIRFDDGSSSNCIFDVSALFHMNTMLTLMESLKPSNPLEYITNLIEDDEEDPYEEV